MKRKLFPYLLILFLMLACTIENYYDFSALFAISSSIWFYLFLSIAISILFNVGLFLFSKIKAQDRIKIYYQLISYFSIALLFVFWVVFLNISLYTSNQIYFPELLSHIYSHVLSSLIYVFTIVIFLSSISITINYKEMK